jgi:uncharacterized membrane protein YbhN (UPF0104 family)
VSEETARGRWPLYAGVAVSAALLTIVLVQIDRTDFTAALARLGAVPFGFAVAGCVAAFVAVAWRFARAVGRLVGEPVAFLDVIRTYLPIVLAANLLAHGLSLGGEVARLLFLKQRHGLDLPTGLGVLVADRLIGIAAVFVLAVPLVLGVFWPASLELRLLGLLAFAVFAGAGGALAAAYAPRLARVARLQPASRIVMAYVGGLRPVIEQVAIACAATLALALAIFSVSRGIGTGLPFGIALAATPIIYIGASVPFTYAGWGSREVACLATLAWTGWMSPADALAVSVMLGIAAFAATLPGLVVLRRSVR